MERYKLNVSKEVELTELQYNTVLAIRDLGDQLVYLSKIGLRGEPIRLLIKDLVENLDIDTYLIENGELTVSSELVIDGEFFSDIVRKSRESDEVHKVEVYVNERTGRIDTLSFSHFGLDFASKLPKELDKEDK